jgi:saccharopine dehydrogenase (NAD+, L-lysine forming)
LLKQKLFTKLLNFLLLKIVLTGSGRVANGAAEVLNAAGILKVSPKDFLQKDFKQAVYTQLDCDAYVAENNGKGFDMDDFFDNPQNYHSIFQPYTQVADLMINGIYWDKRAPAFFTADEMKRPDFKIKVIADITCDIAPESSVPSTLYASTIAEPVFGYDVQSGKASTAYQENTVDVMSIDNLPNELPRDASKAFGEQFIVNVLDELLGISDNGMIERATIAKDGKLGKHFNYLKNYAEIGEDAKL